MNYDRMTKAELIKIIEKLQFGDLTKTGQKFLAIVSEDNDCLEGETIQTFLKSCETFSSEEIESSYGAEIFIDLVYWDKTCKKYVGVIGGSLWNYVLPITDINLLKPFVIGE